MIPLPGSVYDRKMVVASCYLADDNDSEVWLLLLLATSAPYYIVAEVESRGHVSRVVVAQSHANINDAVADYADCGGDN